MTRFSARVVPYTSDAVTEPVDIERIQGSPHCATLKDTKGIFTIFVLLAREIYD